MTELAVSTNGVDGTIGANLGSNPCLIATKTNQASQFLDWDPAPCGVTTQVKTICQVDNTIG